jgi:drug/metabolite transporter (DMT)-like permease
MGTLVLAVLLARYEGLGALRLPRDPLQWLRGVAISISAVGMFLAVWIMPLAEATTIVFTQPIITAVLAMVFLRERARLSTWLATLVAFAGVFLVLRPNFETAGWGVLLPVLSATGMAVTIIANRTVSGRASVLAMQYYMSITAMLFLAVATAVAHFSGLENFRVDWPEWSVIARCVFIGMTATLAHLHGHREGGSGNGGADDLRPVADGGRSRPAVLRREARSDRSRRRRGHHRGRAVSVVARPRQRSRDGALTLAT